MHILFWILPGNPLSSLKNSQELRVCGGYRPFSRRYWVASGNSTIAPGEFLKNHYTLPICYLLSQFPRLIPDLLGTALRKPLTTFQPLSFIQSSLGQIFFSHL